ncbi:MAG: ABC transporter permease [Acidobacteriota bacterium]|nr:ABC transporter permease [Acidobacteriota bacterium]MDH3786659.1 ABC transporter permease [Acidobacteriota bacterium]
MGLLRKLWAFIKRDFISMVSYRLAFLLQIGGMFLTLLAFFYMTGMINPESEGLEGYRPFDWFVVGLAFQFYFSTALYAFSAKMRSEQLLGTLEAMLVTPTPTSMVIFSSAAWDFTFGAIRVIVLLTFAVLVFDVQLYASGLVVFFVGAFLTLFSSAGLGILSASFILYFKRGDPINFLLSGATTFLGTVFFPVEQLPERIRFASEILPITHSLRIVRGALLQGQSWDQLGGEVVTLAWMTLILLPSGLYFARFAIRSAKREGTLVHY